MQVTNINETKTQLSNLIHRALAGEEVIIARAGEPLARLGPIHQDSRLRSGGQLKGQIKIAGDFDAEDPQLQRLFSGNDHKSRSE
jgi:antitoxin (DNA-binding transcriptional repressor) of toxin-antitoxin stability system